MSRLVWDVGRADPRGSERLGEREGGVKVELKPRTGGPRGSGEFGAFSPFRGESGRGEALSGSFLGREGPQKSTPYPGFKLEFKKHTSNPKMQLRTRGGFLNLKSKLHLDFTNVPHAVH